ncbi:MAG: metal ABC transporter substrate-binding protein [Clostridia bacterium]|nr:metal ABC transporter substrate-binding protein [Clostridia bacterium]
MKKLLCLVMAIVLLTSMCSCKTSDDDDKLSVVCTVFPNYDWTRQIIGNLIDNYQLTLLMDSGVDLHSYQATTDDIVTISTCDMLIYIGGNSDKWIEDTLAQATNDDMIVINLMDVLGDAVLDEEHLAGTDEHDHEHDVDKDEHIWLSLKNAIVCCNYIASQLATLDSANASVYQSNMQSYVTQLDDLDTQFQSVVDNAETATLLFADRFPFLYLVHDYNITYYAAFSGCSAETEASFETIAFLAGKVDELSLKYLIVLEGSQVNISQSIINSTSAKNQTVLTLNSLQTTNRSIIDAGATYLAIMQSNLAILTTALS